MAVATWHENLCREPIKLVVAGSRRRVVLASREPAVRWQRRERRPLAEHFGRRAISELNRNMPRRRTDGREILAAWRPRRRQMSGRCASVEFQTLAPGNDFELAANSVLDRNYWYRLEFESRQHGTELVHGERIVAIRKHVAAPVAYS